MTIEPVTELGSGGALRLPRAHVVPMSAPPASCTAAVERCLTGAGVAKSSARIHRISLTTWGWVPTGEPAPTGHARRGTKPPVFPVAAIDHPALPEVASELQDHSVAPLPRIPVTPPAAPTAVTAAVQTAATRL